MIRPYIPDITTIKAANWQELLCVFLILAAVIGFAICIARYAADKFKGNQKAVILGFTALSLLMSAALICFFGFTATTLKGIILSLILLFSSYQDIKTRECDDYLSVMLVVAAMIGTEIAELPGMFLAAMFASGIMIMTVILFDGNIGGADIKIASACTFLLGLQKGIIGFMVGLLLAVLVNAVKNRKKTSGFPMIPYLAVGFTAAYFI